MTGDERHTAEELDRYLTALQAGERAQVPRALDSGRARLAERFVRLADTTQPDPRFVEQLERRLVPSDRAGARPSRLGRLRGMLVHTYRRVWPSIRTAAGVAATLALILAVLLLVQQWQGAPSFPARTGADVPASPPTPAPSAQQEQVVWTRVFRQHLRLTLIPWLAGGLLGGALGYLTALGIRRLFDAAPRLRRWSVLLPWRTAVIVTALYFVLAPVLVITRFGIGPDGAVVQVGLVLAIASFALVAHTLLTREVRSLATRLVDGARTLAALAAAVAALSGQLGAGGAGAVIYSAISRLNWSLALRGTLVVAAVSALIDVALGVASLWIRTRSEDS